jgi:RNA polymerase sigma-70 factor (ECF subfamily)
LVAICTRLTGDRFAAEDLAQETLLEAWRHGDTVRDPIHLQAWLSGIARNVCLRWHRSRRRVRGLCAITDIAIPDSENRQSDRFLDEADLEIELEHRELMELLDRALESLPPDARAALIARFVWDLPLAEIAVRAGISVPAATMRVQRAKRAMHQILTTTFRADITPYLIDVTIDGWQETRLWCFVCGQRHLKGQVGSDSTLQLSCPGCFPAQTESLFDTCQNIWGSVKGYGRAVSRTFEWMDSYYQIALSKRTVTCYVCGTEIPVCGSAPMALGGWGTRQVLGFFHRCHSCGAECSQPLAGLALASPAGRRFHRDHPRIRLLPEQEIERDGHIVVVERFASITNCDTLDVIFARDSGRLHLVQYEP